jgi:ubiquinone/menaquinone biosynthesis C-methylase UbiE
VAKTFGHTDRSKLRFLDLGCGQGASTWFLAREGFDVVAIDGSVSALRKADFRLSKEGLTFKPVVGHLTNLPFDNYAFDAVIDIISTVHNTREDMELIFEETARVMKPGAKLFSIMPTTRCHKAPFKDRGTTTFMNDTILRQLLNPKFSIKDILNSSYEIRAPYICKFDTWIITAERKA